MTTSNVLKLRLLLSASDAPSDVHVVSSRGAIHLDAPTPTAIIAHHLSNSQCVLEVQTMDPCTGLETLDATLYEKQPRLRAVKRVLYVQEPSKLCSFCSLRGESRCACAPTMRDRAPSSSAAAGRFTTTAPTDNNSNSLNTASKSKSSLGSTLFEIAKSATTGASEQQQHQQQQEAQSALTKENSSSAAAAASTVVVAAGGGGGAGGTKLATWSAVLDIMFRQLQTSSGRTNLSLHAGMGQRSWKSEGARFTRWVQRSNHPESRMLLVRMVEQLNRCNNSPRVGTIVRSVHHAAGFGQGPRYTHHHEPQREKRKLATMRLLSNGEVDEEHEEHGMNSTNFEKSKRKRGAGNVRSAEELQQHLLEFSRLNHGDQRVPSLGGSLSTQQELRRGAVVVGDGCATGQEEGGGGGEGGAMCDAMENESSFAVEFGAAGNGASMSAVVRMSERGGNDRPSLEDSESGRAMLAAIVGAARQEHPGKKEFADGDFGRGGRIRACGNAGNDGEMNGNGVSGAVLLLLPEEELVGTAAAASRHGNAAAAPRKRKQAQGPEHRTESRVDLIGEFGENGHDGDRDRGSGVRGDGVGGGGGGKLFSCPHCPMQSKHKGHLNEHLQAVHLKLKRFVCDVCNKAFSTSGNMHMHKRTVHDDGAARRFACTQCPARFQLRSKLKRHVIGVHGEKVP